MPIWRACAAGPNLRRRYSPKTVRILVTGAGGFAGQYLLRDLLADGDVQVFGGTLSGMPPEQGVLVGSELQQVRWLSLDVSSGDSVTQALRQSNPERVFHLAAQSSVALSFADPLATWAANATGTAELLYALPEHAPASVRMLVVSSAEVYGVVPEAEQPIHESRPMLPVNPYAASKAAAEMAAVQQATTGAAQVIVARSFPHTGPGQDVRFALAGWARQLAEIRFGESPAILRVGNLSARRDYSDVRDTVRAYRHLLERGQSNGVYNVCSGRAFEMGELLRQMIDLSGTGARVEMDTDRFRPVDVPLLSGDPTRLHQTGWQANFTLEQTLVDLLRYAESLWAAGA